MEALALSMTGGGTLDQRRLALERLVPSTGRAWQLAMRVAGSAEAAEDAVQQACLAVLNELPAGLPPDEERLWFFGAAANAARMQLRTDRRRRKREAEHMGERISGATAPGLSDELVGAIREALMGLDEKYRLPVALCCEQGFTKREAAAILRMPESTVSKYVGVGLERLREALKQSGHAAAPAAVVGALAHTAPPVPATLAAAVEKLLAEGAAGKGASGVAAASAVLKGGLIVKIGLGIAAAGLVAGGVFWAVGGKSEEASKPKAPSAVEGAPEKPKPKFATPCTDPSAEWECAGWYSASGAYGDMDGPRLDFMRRTTVGLPAVGCIKAEGNERTCLAYDAKLDRVYTAAGSAYGYFDGPFSRARFVGGYYSARGKSATSPDNRYVFETEPQVKLFVRRMDYAKQEVRTLPLDISKGYELNGLATYKDQLYAVASPSGTATAELLVTDLDAKTVKKLPLKLEGAIGNWGCSLALDKVHDRIYASRLYVASVPWYIWYWDLKDGSFHGVLPMAKKPGPGDPANHNTGPFEGTDWYQELNIRFGPDDPEKRYLWVGCTDMANNYLVDLVAKEIRALSPIENRKPLTLKFVGGGGELAQWNPHGHITFLPDGSGDFYIPHNNGGPDQLFRRVK